MPGQCKNTAISGYHPHDSENSGFLFGNSMWEVKLIDIYDHEKTLTRVKTQNKHGIYKRNAKYSYHKENALLESYYKRNLSIDTANIVFLRKKFDSYFLLKYPY